MLVNFIKNIKYSAQVFLYEYHYFGFLGVFINPIQILCLFLYALRPNWLVYPDFLFPILFIQAGMMFCENSRFTVHEQKETRYFNYLYYINVVVLFIFTVVSTYKDNEEWLKCWPVIVLTLFTMIILYKSFSVRRYVRKNIKKPNGYVLFGLLHLLKAYNKQTMCFTAILAVEFYLTSYHASINLFFLFNSVCIYLIFLFLLSTNLYKPPVKAGFITPETGDNPITVAVNAPNSHIYQFLDDLNEKYSK